MTQPKESDRTRPLSLAVLVILGLVAVSGIGIVDGLTGHVRLSLLYVIVIVVVSWRGGPAVGVIFAAISTLILVTANAVTGTDALTDGIFAISVGSDFLVFVFCAIGTYSLRETLTRERTKRRNLARYLPAEFANRLAEEGLNAQVSKRYVATILFVDIRGFTTLTQSLPNDQVFALLLSYRRLVSDAVRKWGGFVDKFIGDGVLAIFGVAEGANGSAARATECALEILDELTALNERQRRSSLPSLRIGIGVHTGEIIAGAIGDEERLEFTALGDTVNVAARIEDLSRDLGIPLLVSETAWQSLSPALLSRYDWVELCVPNVRGLADPLFLAYPQLPQSIAPSGQTPQGTGNREAAGAVAGPTM